MIKYYLVAFLAVLLTVVSQLLLKKGTIKRKNVIDLFLNIYSIIGAFSFVFVTLLMIWVLKYIPLKDLIFITPISYILVTFFSNVIFKEKISKQKIKGLIFISLGIIIFNLDKFIETWILK